MAANRVGFVQAHGRWLPLGIVTLSTAGLALWCLTLTLDLSKPIDRQQDVLFIEATPSDSSLEDRAQRGVLVVDLDHTLRIRDDGRVEEALGIRVHSQAGKPIVWKSITVNWSGNDTWNCDAESDVNPDVPQGEDGEIPSFAHWKVSRTGSIARLMATYSVSRLNKQPLRPLDHAEMQIFRTDQHWVAQGINCSRVSTVTRRPSAVTVADPVEAIVALGANQLVATTPHYEVIAPVSWSRLDGSAGVVGDAPAQLAFYSMSYLGLDLNASLDLQAPGLSNDIEFAEPGRQRDIDSSVGVLTILASALLGMVLQALTWPRNSTPSERQRIGKAPRLRTGSRTFKRAS